MAKIHDNIIMQGLSGKLGNKLVFRTLRDGTTVVCKVPNFTDRKLSKAQKEHHKRFQDASAYAKSASRTQPIYAQLAAGTLKNAYNVALGDWFHPPVIRRVERRGKAIRVRASDDVMVAGVQVMILDEQGKVVEQGEAAPVGADWWELTPQAAGSRLIVKARDLAGNVAEMELGE